MLGQIRNVIRILLAYVALALRVVPALFRSRRDQAIVELAPRQQLRTALVHDLEE